MNGIKIKHIMDHNKCVMPSIIWFGTKDIFDCVFDDFDTKPPVGAVGCMCYDRCPPSDLFVVVNNNDYPNKLKVIYPRYYYDNNKISFGTDTYNEEYNKYLNSSDFKCVDINTYKYTIHDLIHIPYLTFFGPSKNINKITKTMNRCYCRKIYEHPNGHKYGNA
jgi:hypothetical protein